MVQTFAKVINVPDYPPREKHPTIFNGFDELKSGEFMQIVNDHDPRPLQYQFMMERTDEFTWEYLEQGPETWRVEVGSQPCRSVSQGVAQADCLPKTAWPPT